MQCQKIRIRQLPVGCPKANDDFAIETILLPSLKPGEILIEAEWISVDPYLRGKLPAWGINAIMQSNQIAKVLQSRNDDYIPGEYLFGHFQWATKSIITAKDIDYRVPSDPSFSRSHFVGAYGMPGETAWYGMIEVAKLKHGENVLVSGAAGAVGSIVGQIAKLYDCFVVGICGTDTKCKWLTEQLRFDIAINYKTMNGDSNAMVESLSKAFNADGKHSGIDVYYDNTGGFITESVWDLLNVSARVLICGQIANYNKGGNLGRLEECGGFTPPKIDDFLYKLVYREIHILGMLVNNFKDQREYKRTMKKWIEDGRIQTRETLVQGFENIPQAFVGLFSGQNIGKMVVQCSGEVCKKSSFACVGSGSPKMEIDDDEQKQQASSGSNNNIQSNPKI